MKLTSKIPNYARGIKRNSVILALVWTFLISIFGWWGYQHEMENAIKLSSTVEAASPGSSLTLNRIYFESHRHINNWWIALGLFWLIGIGGISFGASNILKRGRAEKEWHDSEKRLGLALHGAALGTWDWNIKSGEEKFNTRWAEMLGYRIEEIKPFFNSWKELIHPDDLNTVETILDAHLKEEIPFYEAEYRIRHKSGHYLWVLDRGKVLERESDGKPLRACGTHLDITKRKKRQEELKRSQTFLQTVIDSFPDAIMVINLDYSIILANQVVREMAGSDPVINSLKCHQVSHGQDTPCSDGEDICIMQEVIKTRKTVTANHIHTNSAGEKSLVEIQAAPIFDDNGEVIQIIESCRDITERRQHEEERLLMERQLRHTQKLESLGVLAGGIAHDFNNILMVIQGNTDLALIGLPPQTPLRKKLLDIEKACHRATELTNQMLAYSGKGKFTIEPINLNYLVQNMLHLLEISISQNAALKFNFTDHLPFFLGDPTQIRQIIINLIINASEALGIEKGIISIATGAMDCNRDYLATIAAQNRSGSEEPLSEGPYVYLEVQDTGCGMDKDTQEKLFDPFFTTKFIGRGLGMAAVQGIVHGHNGVIDFNSEIDCGSTFRILFPKTEYDRPAEKQGIALQPEKEWLGKGTILIADDEEAIIDVGKLLLAELGFDVLTAADGREAVEVFRKHADEIVCVLLDLTMPYMNGEEAFWQIRQIRPDAKVILSSGYNEQEITENFTCTGLAGFIQKPYKSSELSQKIRGVLEKDHD